MAAGLLILPGAQPSRSRNGGAVSAELRFYENNTTTPKTVYAESTLTTPLSFPVVSDDAGRFVQIWAEAGTDEAPNLFTVNWGTQDGQVETWDNIRPATAIVDGAAATIAVGTTTTLSAGSSATVTNSGSSSAAVFNFGIPRGAAATVTAGTTTTSSPGTSASVVNSGTTSAAVFDFTIPRGDVGPAPNLTIGTVTSGTPAAATITGTNPNYVLGLTLPQGDAATIAVGTVTTGAPGSSATVTNVGSSSAAIFNFSIPQGNPGSGTGSVNTTGSVSTNDIAVYADTTGDLIKAGVPATMRSTLGLVIGTDVQAYSANLAAFSGVTGAADRLFYFTGSGTGALATFTAFGRSLVDDADAAAARTTLGLGTIATQAASSVAITGGSITGITDLVVADGGTGVSTLTDGGVLIGNGTGAIQATAVGTAGQVLTSNGPGTDPTFQTAAGGTPQILWARQTQPSGTNPSGTATNGAWNPATFNTTAANTISGAVVGVSSLTLPAGSYLVWGIRTATTANGGAQAKPRLYNSTDAVNLIVSPISGNAFGAIVGLFTIAATKTLSFDLYISGSTNLGSPISSGEVEVYADILFQKIA